MKFERTDIWGFEHATRGMRNPMNSWDKGDTGYAVKDYELHNGEEKVTYDTNQFGIGPNDINLMQRLINGGSEHRKFMRQIMVSVDITAPLFWYKEFDTYKIGTTANSTSTMHKLASEPITIESFEIDDFVDITFDTDYGHSFIEDTLIPYLEQLRQAYNQTKDKRYWKELVRWLPEGWLQTRTVTMNYENLYSIVRQRKGHKLTEWKQFIDWVHTLPYADELIFYNY